MDNVDFNLNPRSATPTDDGLSWDKCLCHKPGNEGALTNFTDVSWGKLQECAEIRQDNVYESLKTRWNEGPRGGYHRSCYQEYTHKQKLDRIQRKRKLETETQTVQASTSTYDESTVKRTSRSSVPGRDYVKCIICQGDKVSKENRRLLEPLRKTEMDKASDTLVNAAEVRKDTSLLLHIKDKDLPALDVKYHKSCYDQYTNRKTIDAIKPSSNPTIEETIECYETAFQTLAKEVNQHVIVQLDVMKMSSLRLRYVELLLDLGVNAHGYRTEKLKKRLINHFGDRIGFWHPSVRNEAEFVFANTVEKGQIIEAGVSAVTTASATVPMDVPRDSREDDVVNSYHCAKYVRKLLKDVVCSMPWPPTPEDLTEDNVNIPVLVYNFLAWIISDVGYSESPTEERVTIPESLHQKVLSVGQDLLHITTNDRVKTPKHIVLPMTVKNLTGCSQLITILNRFGHGISYPQVQEIETAVAEIALDRPEGEVVVPSNTVPNVFATFCWDNNDINEETLTGRDTTHCTNGIVIQRQVDSCAPMLRGESKSKTRHRSVIPPQAPAVLPYNAGKRVGLEGPIPIDLNMFGQTMECQEPAMEKDFAWFLTRLNVCNSLFEWNYEELQRIAGWTPFNAKLRENMAPRLSRVGYCQVIDASPTDLATVYTVLKRSVEMADKLELKDVVAVFDQAIYAKALDVVLKNPVEFDRVVLRMGAFHTACTMLSVIGKRFGDAGLADVLIESAIVGTGSVSGVLDGRHYNRAIRVHKIVLEALLRMRWQSYGQHMTDSKSIPGVNQQKIIDGVQNVRSACSAETFDELRALPDFANLVDSYTDFVQGLTDPMSQFWNSYIDMVSLLLRFIRSTREGDWESHLSTLATMIPWFFAYDRTNYARYTPVYLSQMLLLENTHPEAHRNLLNGEFAVQRSTHNGFGQVPVDQTIEQTLNRDTKTKGGIIGFSLRKGAVQRWMITAHTRAAITQNCRIMAGLKDDDRIHKQASQHRIDLDETDVQRVSAVFNNWTNPFEPSNELYELYNVASGVVASESLRYDLIDAYVKGEHKMNTFVADRIQTNAVDFHDPLPQMKLKTFTSEIRSSGSKVPGREKILKADRNLFAMLLVIAQARSLNLHEVMKHELGPYPWSIATADGSLAKTTKSTMMDLIEKDTEPVEHVPSNAARIIDGMVLLHSLTNIPVTFAELATLLFGIITHGSNSRVDFVTDQYPDISIKNTERLRRSRGGTLVFRITNGAQKCPRQWKKFLSDGGNKAALVEFLAREWSDPRFACTLEAVDLYIAHGEQCQKLSAVQGHVQTEDIPELFSNHEEADTRMFLHALHAANHGHDCVVIRTVDVDVEILACYLCRRIPARLIIHTGTKNRARYVDINVMAEKLGDGVCNALPGLHAFTGCDSTSSFAGRGKKRAFDIVSADETMCKAMQLLGGSFNVNDELVAACEAFVCNMYGRTGTDVNELRYSLLCHKNMQTHKLPPTADALVKHVKRANYQAAIWRESLEPQPDVPSPDGNGWTVKDGRLNIDWMMLPPAPAAVMQLLSCGCKGSCDTKKCSCRSNELPCTDACKCVDKCKNRTDQATHTSDDSNDEYDE